MWPAEARERERGGGDGGEAGVQVYVSVACVAECVRPTGVQLYAQLRVCAKVVCARHIRLLYMYSCTCMCVCAVAVAVAHHRMPRLCVRLRISPHATEKG